MVEFHFSSFFFLSFSMYALVFIDIFYLYLYSFLIYRLTRFCLDMHINNIVHPSLSAVQNDYK